MSFVADRLDGWQRLHRAELHAIRKVLNQRITPPPSYPR
jgi:hypothetical protein